jgi:hypothetical protein
VILQVLRGVHADPCDRLSPIVLLEDLDTAPFDYLKTIPDLSVGNEFEAWIGDLPGSGAHAEATTEAPTCAELWPWSETTEAFTAIPRGTDVRLLTFYFDGQQLLFTVFGEDRIPDRRATIDELINSFRFAPSPRASVSGTIRVLLEMPFRFTLPDGMSLTAALLSRTRALASGRYQDCAAWSSRSLANRQRMAIPMTIRCRYPRTPSCPT